MLISVVAASRPSFSQRSAWHWYDLLRLLRSLDCCSAVDGVTCFHGFIDNDSTGERDGWVIAQR